MNPNKYWSLIIDGMDQAKHYLSHFTTSTKVKSIQLEHVLNIMLECFRILNASVIGSSLQKSWHWQNIPGRCWVVPYKHQRCTRSHWHNSHHTCMYLHRDLAYAIRCEHQFIIGCFNIIAFHCYTFSSGRRRYMEIKNASHRCSCQPETRSPCVSWFMRVPPWF